MPSHSACNRNAASRDAASRGTILPPPAQGIEILEDDAGVVIRIAVLGEQHRYFAQRILPPHAVVGIGRVGSLDLHVLIEAEHGDRNPYLAAERRRRRGTQNHHRGTITGLIC